MNRIDITITDNYDTLRYSGRLRRDLPLTTGIIGGLKSRRFTPTGYFLKLEL